MQSLPGWSRSRDQWAILTGFPQAQGSLGLPKVHVTGTIAPRGGKPTSRRLTPRVRISLEAAGRSARRGPASPGPAQGGDLPQQGPILQQRAALPPLL